MNGNRAYWDVKRFCVASAERSENGLSIAYTGGAMAWDLIGVSITPTVISSPHASQTGGRKMRYKALGADITVSHEPETLEKRALLFGHALDDGSTQELSYGIQDVPQPVGVTFYRALNDDTYEGVFLPWAIFSEGTSEAQAALDGINYSTGSTTGSAEADPNGNYQYVKSFATEKEAIAWCNTKLNIQDPTE